MLNVEHLQPTVRSLSEIIYSAISLARLCLRMDVAFVTEFKDGLRVFRHVVGSEAFLPIKEGDADPLEESYCQYVVNGKIPPVVSDSHIYPILKALPSTQKMSIRAHMGVPIRLSDGSVYGTFCCYSRKPGADVRDIDVAVMCNFAELLANTLENQVLAERAFVAMSNRISEIISQHALQVAYQPITALASGEVVGFEALSRFPAEFGFQAEQWFQQAHQVSRGVELELLATRLAIVGMGKIGPSAYLALNVSPETILSGLLDESLLGVPREKVVLEVTEHVPIAQYQALVQSLAPLRADGVRLAVDDAGSGYASFRHILELNPDIIKLDKSLIRDIDAHAGQRALASALIAFANETGSKVVAEGVETEGELAALRSLGVGLAQGYLLGKPTFLFS